MTLPFVLLGSGVLAADVDFRRQYVDGR